MALMIQQMEKELESVKKKGIHESIIEQKEQRIEEIITALNFADELIQLLIFQLKTSHFEISILSKQVTEYLMNDPLSRDSFFSNSHTMETMKDFVNELKRVKE